MLMYRCYHRIILQHVQHQEFEEVNRNTLVQGMRW